jgi:hypothetical protein
MSSAAANDNVCTDGAITPDDWLVNAATLLSATPTSTASAEQINSAEATTAPAVAIEPAITGVAEPQMSLAHFDNTMIAVTARLAEIERLLVANHMNSVPFTDDPIPFREHITDTRTYRTRVFNAPPRSRSVITRRYRSF